MGSELLQRLPEGSRLELAVHEHPKAVLDIHLAYIEAGAELIETATFGSSRPRLERGRAGQLTETVNAAAVKLAREAREISGRDILVAGSIGPPVQSVESFSRKRSEAGPPNTMAPIRPFPSGKASSNAAAGLSYQSTDGCAPRSWPVWPGREASPVTRTMAADRTSVDSRRDGRGMSAIGMPPRAHVTLYGCARQT